MPNIWSRKNGKSSVKFSGCIICNNEVNYPRLQNLISLVYVFNMTSIENLKCVFCSEVFDDKEILQEHFRKHGDPIFDKSSKNKNKAQNEVPTSTEKMEENEIVGCDVCEEVFPTISKAITHKHKVHPDHDTKYFCPWCGKLFTMKHLYNKHLLSNHNGLTNSNEKGFHCDSCCVYFYIPSAMLHHNKFFHRQDTDLNSIGSSKKIKLYNQELVPIFYCPFCGEEYNNKVNLHKHMEVDHGDENQTPEDVLRCPLCEAFFYHLDAYELHLTFHSTEDVYSEQNEIVGEITEFSLEAVPPIMEKVLQDTKIDPVNNFLETLMNVSEGRVKTKKHKKHKKSKKEAITFDEFLNMNKDVFGDGINVQGIEEVPTQMVLKKKYKTKKMANNMEVKNVNSDLAKLKKQGISIKAKSTNTTPLNIQKKTSISQSSTMNPPVTSNASDVISKLLSHGNREIKIVKKSVQMPSENKQDNYQSDKIDSSSDYNEPLNITSQTCTKENENVLCDKPERENCERSITQEFVNKSNEDSENDFAKEDNEYNNELTKRENIDSQNDFVTKQNRTSLSDIEEDNYDENTTSNAKDTIESKIPIKSLQNIGSQLTIKSLNSTITKKNINGEQKGVVQHKEDKESLEESFNEIDDQKEDQITEKSTKNDTLKSLNLFKGITVKSISNDNSQSSTFINENQERKINQQQQNVMANKSLEALKGLSKFISVKPSNLSPPLNQNLLPTDYYDQEDRMSDDENSNEDTNTVCDKSLSLKQQFIDKKAISDHKQSEEEDQIKTKIIKTNTSLDSQKHADILKRLPNVTAKSISTAKNTPLTKNTIKSTPISANKETTDSKSDNKIEIFNIDDSDSDVDVENVGKIKRNYICKRKEISPLENLTKTDIIKTPSTDDLRGLSKNIKIKTISQQSCNYTEYQSKTGQECKKTVINRSYETKNVNFIQGTNKFLEEQKNLQETIKNLRRHISIKPKKSPHSELPPPESIDDAANVGQAHYDEEHDSNSSISRVKITELNEEEMSDTENQHSDYEGQVRVESPHSYNSCDEERHNDEIDDDFTDFQNQNKADSNKNTNQHITTPIQSRKTSNISHLNELTIKPVRQGNQLSENEISANDKISGNIKNVPNVPRKSNNNKQVNEKQISKNVQTSKKASATSNQTSVKTVKTFQSQTVIEEVTTTVTKTVRTLNTQEVQNASQVTSRPIIRPQKIMNKPVNNIRTPIRQAAPAIGTKVRHSVPISQSMSPTTGIVRPSNMLVPVRPRLNSPRTPNPSNIRKKIPVAQNQPRSAYHQNRPLKISPHVTNIAKRQSDAPSGHFSCFKKPKESLIPVHDLPNVSDDSEIQYASMQTKSSFSNVTKVFNDNSMASTSQTRSETTTSSQQHIAKLSGMSGLKIIKTSTQQSKQIEEKCEVNSPQNNTIAALEKLQRQGLLIKKPRLDLSDHENNSFSGSDGENFED